MSRSGRQKIDDIVFGHENAVHFRRNPAVEFPPALRTHARTSESSDRRFARRILQAEWLQERAAAIARNGVSGIR